MRNEVLSTTTRIKNKKVLAILRLLRLKHYIKNTLICVPLFFSLNFFNFDDIKKTLLAFIAFSFIASFIYIINDIADIDKDRMHPIKCKRPIAAGEVSKKEGYLIAAVLLITSISLSIYVIRNNSVIIVITYMIMNLLYSFKLKNIPIIDVAVIALGFILRIYMGAISINVQVSKWLLLTIMALSFYLGFGKRRNEMIKITNNKTTRCVLTKYNMNFLDKAMSSMMTLAIGFYSLWTIDSIVIKSFKSDRLIFTVPIVIIGLFRYSLIVEGDSYGDPTDIILKDKFMQSIIVIYVIVVFLLIYI